MSEYKIGDEVVIVETFIKSDIGKRGVVFDYQGIYNLRNNIPIRLYDTIYYNDEYHGYLSYQIRHLTPLEKAMK